jgi:uncharacterized protein
MIVDLTKPSEREIDFSFAAQPDLEDESARIAEPVKVEGKLRKGIAQVDVNGRISGGAIEMECQRCLTPTKIPLDFPFSATFVTEENYTDAKEAELRGADLDVSVYEDERIDLGELAREQILLNLPTQALCREDCKGLCPKCGANLNETACDCASVEIDPRWRGLSELKIKNEK